MHVRACVQGPGEVAGPVFVSMPFWECHEGGYRIGFAHLYLFSAKHASWNEAGTQYVFVWSRFEHLHVCE